MQITVFNLFFTMVVFLNSIELSTEIRREGIPNPFPRINVPQGFPFPIYEPGDLFLRIPPGYARRFGDFFFGSWQDGIIRRIRQGPAIALIRASTRRIEHISLDDWNDMHRDYHISEYRRIHGEHVMVPAYAIPDPPPPNM